MTRGPFSTRAHAAHLVLDAVQVVEKLIGFKSV